MRDNGHQREGREAEFDERVGRFVNGIVDEVLRYYETQFPNLTPPQVKVIKGRRYYKVITEDGGGRSVHCFVDTTDGAVLKAASWKRPAKHARGNIWNDDNGLEAVNVYGANYLR